jgi:peptidoglycan biosynthesis protein MviN/MurJ (putative lipid II flippase)
MSRWSRGLLHHGLYALQVGLGLLFQIFFARQFGASSISDAYFAGYVVHAFLGTLPLFFSETFMQHYHEAKARDPRAAHALFEAVSTICLLAGALIAVLSILLVPGIGSVAFAAFNAETRAAFLGFAPLLLISLVISPMVALNNAVLNAEMQFALPLFTGVLAPAANLAILVTLGDRYGIVPLALAPGLAALVALALQRRQLARHLMRRLRWRWRHPELPALMRSSASMRFGHMLYTLKDPLAASFLATLPSGVMSLYFYAQRVMAPLYGLASAPLLQVFMARASGKLADGRLRSVRRRIPATALKLGGVFLAVCIPVAVVLPWILDVLLGQRLTVAQLHLVYWLFLALISPYLLQAMEAAMGGLIITMRRSSSVIVVNLVFLAIVAGTLAVARWYAPSVFALPVALTIAGLSNLVLYYRLCSRLRPEKKRS